MPKAWRAGLTTAEQFGSFGAMKKIQIVVLLAVAAVLSGGCVIVYKKEVPADHPAPAAAATTNAPAIAGK